MIRIRLSSAAERDLLEARSWYAEQSPGLDRALGTELDRVLRRIATFPESAPVVLSGIRRANLKRFPYGIFYLRREDGIFVLGVLHHSRHPRHWQQRI